MSRIVVNTQFNTKKVAAELKAASEYGLTKAGENALEDINMHVPKDQGTLRSSSRINSDIKAKNGEYKLIWATPYANYLYNGDVMHGNPTNRTYGPDKISFTDALACEEWAKYAAEVYGKTWKEVYKAAIARRLK